MELRTATLAAATALEKQHAAAAAKRAAAATLPMKARHAMSAELRGMGAALRPATLAQHHRELGVRGLGGLSGLDGLGPHASSRSMLPARLQWAADRAAGITEARVWRDGHRGADINDINAFAAAGVRDVDPQFRGFDKLTLPEKLLYGAATASRRASPAPHLGGPSHALAAPQDPRALPKSYAPPEYASERALHKAQLQDWLHLTGHGAPASLDFFDEAGMELSQDVFRTQHQRQRAGAMPRHFDDPRRAMPSPFLRSEQTAWAMPASSQRVPGGWGEQVPRVQAGQAAMDVKRAQWASMSMAHAARRVDSPELGGGPVKHEL